MRSARARASDIHMCVWRHVNSILLLRSNAHYADVTKDMIHFTSLSNDRLLPFLVFLVLFLGSHFHYVHLSSLSQSEFKCEWSRKCVRSCVCVQFQTESLARAQQQCTKVTFINRFDFTHQIHTQLSMHRTSFHFNDIRSEMCLVTL